MNVFQRQVCTMAERQLRGVFRGVWATGDLTERGWYMAAALAMGPTGAVSHVSSLMLQGLRPYRPLDVHVSHRGGNRAAREGLVPHRRSQTAPSRNRAAREGLVPHRRSQTAPSRALSEADLPSHELYRAIEEAEKRGLPLTLPLGDVVRVRAAVRGFTRSDTEARFLFLLHEAGLELPEVNQILNGYEADFHWPRPRLVVEVDGWKHHRDHDRFNDDRYRGLVHEARGCHVIRISANHVYSEKPLILRSLRAFGVRASADRPAPAFA